MAASPIYFDPEELKRGQFFEIDSTLVADDGRSYLLGEWIARGGNGSVFRCIERSSGIEFAVKFLMDPSGKILKRFYREVRLLKELQHEHIVRYRGTGKTRNLGGRYGLRCPSRSAMARAPCCPRLSIRILNESSDFG